MSDQEKVMEYIRKKYNKPDMKEETCVYKMVRNSIEFIKLLSELEEIIDKEILLEKVEDISKLTIGNICNYV